MSNTVKYAGGCPHDCPDTCAMIYEVRDNKLVSTKGNPDHPLTQGGLCVKLKDYEKRHYHPDRLLHPMRRCGEKGTNSFEKITWDEALTEISTRWKSIIEKYGAQSIAPYSYAGHQGLVHGINGGDAFFNRLGASVMERTMCGSGLATAWLMTNGPSGGMDPESFAHSKFILIWACNSVSTNVHHWHVIKKAQKNGATVVVIDPYRSRTAQEADWHIAPRVGTDGALAMSLIHTIIEENLIDEDYVKLYTQGYNELKERAQDWSAEKASAVTGIEAKDIRELARQYAGTKSAAIRIGVALERHEGGGQAIRAVCCLPSLTGAWREVGGGIFAFPFWEHPYQFDKMCRPDWIPEGTQVINNLQIGNVLTGQSDKKQLHALMCWNSNPVTQAPDSRKVIEGLMRDDLFLVVADHFITDTASYADIILPATMGAEMEDIILSWGHNYLTYNTKCVDAPGDALSNREIFRRLAQYMGFDDEEFQWSDSECLERFIDWESPVCEGIDLDYLREHGFARLNVGAADDRAPHREGNFPTPSGKCEFQSSIAKNGNFVVGPFRQMYEDFQGAESLDDLPDFIPSHEIVAFNSDLEKQYPLNLVSPKSHGFLNSCYANMKHKIKGQGDQFLLISSDDAMRRNIKNGEQVEIFNGRGHFLAVAHLSEDVPEGLVLTTLGYWNQLNNGTANHTSSQEFSDLGHAPSYSDNLVEVKRC